jgi:transposase
MRKAINGLCQIVESEGMGDLMGPHLFVFTGRRRDVIKILYFDRSGFALWQKRLEKERFRWPKDHDSGLIRLTTSQLQWLLDGYDFWRMRPFEELRFSRVS